MSRINTNIPSMVAARIFNAQNQTLNQSLTRLSTGLRINVGKDDPAGLIASEGLRAEKVAIAAALTNIVRANNVVSTAESGLEEVNKLLTDLERLIDLSANEAGLTEAEREANQLQIDSILDSINRIGNSTEFQGRKLLNGELDYILSTSGSYNNNFNNVNITSARIPEGSFRNVVVEVTGSAQLAALDYASASINGAVTLEVAGNQGTEVFSFASGTTISAVAAAINANSDLTGVSAVAFSSTGLRFNSTNYGSSQYVSVRTLSGNFTLAGSTTKDYGVDASVLINGTQASTDGLTARLQTSGLSVILDLTASFGTTIGSDTFQVIGGGADFVIGPRINATGMASVGVQSITTSTLGDGMVGYLQSLASGQANSIKSGNFSTAQNIVRAAQTQVSELRGRLGAFQKDTLASMSNALNITLENTTAAESAIRDTDFATETSNLTRAQILVQSATNTLRLANQQPQSILALLQ